MNTMASATRYVVGILGLSVCLVGSVARVSGQERAILSDRTLSPPSEVVVQTERRDSSADGTVDYLAITTSTYDRRGNPLTIAVEYDYNVDGILDDLGTTTNTNDHRGHLLTQVFAQDAGANGVIDNTWTTTNTYDERGNLLTQLVEYDGNGDGRVDSSQVRTWSEVVADHD